MVFRHESDPEEEKNPITRSKNNLRIWFYSLIVIPLFYLYYFAEWKEHGISNLIGQWIGWAGFALLVTSTIELIINAASKKRPLISINLRFCILATVLIVLFRFFYWYSLNY